MTARTTMIFRGFYITLIILLIAAISWRASHPLVIEERMKQIEVVKEAGLALKLFADDPEGIMPANFSELFPVYVDNKPYFADVEFVAPGKRLSDLPAPTVSARRFYNDQFGKRYMAVVYADLSATEFKQ